MKRILFILLLAATTAHAGTYGGGDNKENGFSDTEMGSGDKHPASPQPEGLQERLMRDEGLMAIIRSMEDDPEIRALLSDPALLRAVREGDLAALMANPAFMKLLDDPRVKEIEKRVNGSNAKRSQ